MATTIKQGDDGLITTGPVITTGEPLVLTQEATELDLALDELQKVCKRLCDQLDDLTANIKKLTEENNRLKDALGIVESNPIEDLEKILNEK
tara:strand:+ start:550 stop:825 length:276 start_codon:yes stop_codon:yes gene_type:complete